MRKEFFHRKHKYQAHRAQDPTERRLPQPARTEIAARYVLGRTHHGNGRVLQRRHGKDDEEHQRHTHRAAASGGRHCQSRGFRLRDYGRQHPLQLRQRPAAGGRRHLHPVGERTGTDRVIRHSARSSARTHRSGIRRTERAAPDGQEFSQAGSETACRQSDRDRHPPQQIPAADAERPLRHGRPRVSGPRKPLDTLLLPEEQRRQRQLVEYMYCGKRLGGTHQ